MCNMSAIAIIQTLSFAKASTNKLESAQNVLNELHRMKKIKGMPFLTSRRAIRMQEKVVKKLKND